MVRISNPEIFEKLTKIAKKYGYKVEIVGEPDYIKISNETMETIIELKENGVSLFYLEQHYDYASIRFNDEHSELAISTDIDGGLIEVRTRCYHNELFVPGSDLEEFLENPGRYTFVRLGVYMPIDTAFYTKMKSLMLE